MRQRLRDFLARIILPPDTGYQASQSLKMKQHLGTNRIKPTPRQMVIAGIIFFGPLAILFGYLIWKAVTGQW